MRILFLILIATATTAVAQDNRRPTTPSAGYILLPLTPETSGHGTHSNPRVWGSYLKDLLDLTAKK